MTLRRALILAWLAVIAAVTLRAAPDQVDRILETPWYCLACGDAGATDVLLNLLLFLPLGVAARLSGWRIGTTLLMLLLLTTSIEATQAFWLAGRDASLSDILANSAGGVVGWYLLPVLVKALSPTPAFALRAALACLVAGTTVWFATGAGLTIALSPAGPWVGQPLRLWPGHDRFPGALERATMSGIAVSNDPLPGVPTRLDSIDLTLDLTRTSPIASSRPISLLRIVDARQQLQLSAGIRGRNLLIEFRVAASRFLVRTPVWRFEDAAITPVAVPWRFRWFRRAGAVVLQSGAVAGPTQERVVPLSIALGWAFVHPFAPPVGENAPWWSVIWIACWLGPLGWFAGALGFRIALRFGIAAIGAMVVASTITGIPVHSDELLVAAMLLTTFALFGATRRTRLPHDPA
ncbi:MAG: VanZ family protein [Gemmatimonadales bacterium]